MECPKCHFDHPQQVEECLKCGVIFSKYVAFQKAVEAVRDLTPDRSPADIALGQGRAHTEFLCRVFGLPGALLFGWIVNWAMPSVAAFLAMWLHESGHAIAAWFCGYAAFPTAWFTIISERGRWISVVLGAAVAVGGYAAIRWKRWFWVAVSAAVLVLFLMGNLQTDFQSHKLITFWGDGGTYVLATILVVTFYARRESPITRNQVRWGFLILGAIAFWGVYSRWSGGFENIANFLEDTDERGPSDIMQLTTLYGWTVYELIHRYWQLGRTCMVVMAGAYVAGLVQAKSAEAALAREVPSNRSASR